jgi:hypothetical protein
MTLGRITMYSVISIFLLVMLTSPVSAAPGDLLATVNLPGNGGCSVNGTFDGTYYITVDDCPGTVLQIYTPPPGDGDATLVATKNVVDGGGSPMSTSGLAWDPSRNMLWSALNDNVYLIDIGDPTVSGDAVATHQFVAGVGGIGLVDGMAYDSSDDTLYMSPDIDQNVYHLSTTGTLLHTITPKNAAGQADGSVSGVVVGTGNTLYIGRSGDEEIRRIDKTTGDFISSFTSTFGRVEDLTCDPVTYSPLEAILSKDAYGALYEAFEVEIGTCPLQGPPPPPPVPPSVIPTMNEWGMIIFMVIAGIGAAYYLRRKRTV